MVTRRSDPGTMPEGSAAWDAHVVYPEGDGQPLAEIQIHGAVIVDLMEKLQDFFADRPDVYVWMNLFVYYERGNPAAVVAPDVFVAIGAAKEPPRRTYRIWQEGVPPRSSSRSRPSRRGRTICTRSGRSMPRSACRNTTRRRCGTLPARSGLDHSYRDTPYGESGVACRRLRCMRMARPSREGEMVVTTGQSTQQSQGVGSPISNEAYNVISALHSKLEGLEAYRKYQQDGGQIWQQLSQQDTQAVQTLVGELERLVREGRFRMGQPGQG